MTGVVNHVNAVVFPPNEGHLFIGDGDGDGDQTVRVPQLRYDPPCARR
ncbi:hypothetical protein [Streptomyces sp900129855]|uniref:Uncharacterized protein n=1 Tax=Streptomyces sp. 900129855 TaxID=3155129 RepID=A0ABV2ZG14_9ACTN